MRRLIPRSGYATTALATGAAASAMLWLTVAAGPGLTSLGIDLSPQSELSFSHIVRIDLTEIELKRTEPKIPAQVPDDSSVVETDAPETAPASSALSDQASTGIGSRPTAPASPGTLDFTQADLNSIDFELGVGDRLIEKKPAIYGGKTYQIGIRIDSGGKVSASFDDLAQVFGQERVKLLSCCVDKSGYAEFADVRAAGISVAYDPTADRIVLE